MKRNLKLNIDSYNNNIYVYTHRNSIYLKFSLWNPL